MGTHPIFESDFDCLTEIVRMSSYEAAISQLNNLQSNFQVLAAQRKGRNERDHPRTILENHKRVLRSIQNGQLEQKLGQIPLVHIAGTKGKGSTAAFVERLLRQKGYRTGLFTSPHLVSVTERIRIDGRPVEEELFAEHFDFILSQVTRANEIPPAYFAFLTFVAFRIFVACSVDVIVLEVGIGGGTDDIRRK